MPRSLPRRILRALREFFAGDSGVEVVIDRRSGMPRRLHERRAPAAAPGREAERRRIPGAGGRRAGERRTEPAAVPPPADLPPALAAHAGVLRFAERGRPSQRSREDLEVARLVVRVQSGDRDAFTELYERHIARVYGYLSVALGDEHEAQDAAHEVFVRVLRALPRFRADGPPFRVWLLRIVRNYTLSHARKHGRTEVMSPERVALRLEARQSRAAVEALRAIEDSQLVELIRRLPELQRQVIVMRYVMDLGIAEIAEVMERSPDAVRQLHRRAFATLRTRLTAGGRYPDTDSDRLPMRMRAPDPLVTVTRRLALSH